MPAFLRSPKPRESSQNSSNSSKSPSGSGRLAYTKTELTMLKLGFTRADITEMPYSRAAWYVQAVAAEQGDEDAAGVRDATQADIDTF